MSISSAFIAELKHEAAMTRKMLERVPMDKADWRPHPKSMTIGRLATHIAENTGWISEILGEDEFDFMAKGFKSYTAVSQEELLQIFQDKLDKAIADLEAADETQFDRTWVVKRGEQVVYQLPKKAAIRGWAINHNIHHRGQLSVFLRLLDVPVPGMYGPSADER